MGFPKSVIRVHVYLEYFEGYKMGSIKITPIRWIFEKDAIKKHPFFDHKFRPSARCAVACLKTSKNTIFIAKRDTSCAKRQFLLFFRKLLKKVQKKEVFFSQPPQTF